MSGPASVVAWLEDKSDWLSPLVVKEVRQLVRGREFMLSLVLSLLAGLAVAFFGAAEALSGSNTTGGWTFGALMACLAFLGLAVVPLAAFSALRNERMEQTLDLITLTALSPRRIVIGKLLAQVVKLVTLFAAIAPFITMSFLLGGIDFVTILTSIVVLFMWSVWAGALCLFLSTVFKSRAMSGIIFAAVGLLVLFGVVIGRGLFLAIGRGGAGLGPLPGPFGIGTIGASPWWDLIVMATFWLASLINLILLAENRLSLPTEDSVTPLRIGLFAQFLLIAAWALTDLTDPIAKVRAANTLATFGAMHLAVVAVFAVTDELAVPRRVLSRMHAASPWRWLLATFGPGGGRGAAYVLVQMALLLAVLDMFRPSSAYVYWLLAACGYICFFTGVPTLAVWLVAPARASVLTLRVAVLITVAISTVLPDVLYYLLSRPEILDLSFSLRHLINPFRTLDNWPLVESAGWWSVPFFLGMTGLVAYLVLIRLGMQATGEPAPIDPHRPAPVAGETGRGDVAY